MDKVLGLIWHFGLMENSQPWKSEDLGAMPGTDRYKGTEMGSKTVSPLSLGPVLNDRSRNLLAYDLNSCRNINV